MANTRPNTAPTASKSFGSTPSRSGDWTAPDSRINSPMSSRRVLMSTRRFPGGCSSPTRLLSSLPSPNLSLVSPRSSADGEAFSQPSAQVYVTILLPVHSEIYTNLLPPGLFPLHNRRIHHCNRSLRNSRRHIQLRPKAIQNPRLHG